MTYSKVGQVQKRNPQQEIEHHVTIMASDKASQPLNSTITLIVVNKFQCNAIQFLVNETTGVVTADNLCSVTNENSGENIVLLGANKTLKCSAESNMGSAKYQWSKDGSIVSDDSDDGVLVLQNINFEMQGGYSCVARNMAGSLQSATTTLVVHGKDLLLFYFFQKQYTPDK